jgi:translocation and assembly module TamB
MSRASSGGRLVRRIGVGMALTLAFVLGAALAVLVHIDMPASRRLAIAQVNRLLATTFAGSVRIERVDRLGLFDVFGAAARVTDPAGIPVLRIDGIDLRVGTVSLLRSVVGETKTRPIAIGIPSAFVGRVDANLDTDASGELRIARAFAPRSPTTMESASRNQGRGVLVAMPDVRLGHAWVHGAPTRVDVDLSDLSARVHVDPATTIVDVDRLWILSRGAPKGLDPRGLVDGRVVVRASSPEHERRGVEVRARFEGDLGGMSTLAEMHLRDDEIDARLDARDPTGANARAMFSELAVRDRLEVRAEAHGKLPRVDAKATVSLGKANVDASASIDTGALMHVDGRLAARSIDLAAVLEGGPSSDLAFDGRTTFTIRDGLPSGAASLVIRPGVLDHVPVPRTDVSTRFSGQQADAVVRIHEASMPTEVILASGPRADGHGGRTVEASIRSSVPDLRRVPIVGAKAAGSATIEAAARLLLPENALDATVDVHGRQIQIEHDGSRDPSLSMADAHGRISATGTVDKPVIDATLDAEDLAAKGRVASHASARARLELAERVVTLRDPRAEIMYEGQAIGASARRVRIEDGALEVDGAEVTGIGEPIRGDFVKRRHRVSGRIDAPRVDLARVSALAKLDRAVRRGGLVLRGEATLVDGDTNVDLHAEVNGLDVELLHDASAVLDANVHGHDVAVDLRTSLGDAGRFSFRTEELIVDGHGADPAAWRRARGAVRVDMQVDAQKTASVLPRELLRVADLRGELTLQGRVVRDREDGPPEVQLSAHTNGLLVAARSEPERHVDGIQIEAPPRWRSTDMDLGFDARAHGLSGLTTVAARATDPHGAVVALDLKTVLPWIEIVREPSSFATHMMAAPISSKLVIPKRRLDQLPSIFGVKGLEGVVDVDVDAAGTLRDPHLRLAARGRDVRAPAMPLGMRADSDVALAYDDGATDLAMTIRARGREILVASSRIEADVRELIRAKGPAFWTARGQARLAGFPLETIPMMADRGVRGIASGDLSLDGLHEDARLEGSLHVDGLAVGNTTYERATITVDAGDRTFTGRARLDRPDGFLDVAASTGLAWGKQLEPSLDTNQPLEATLLARSLPAAIFQPFVESVVPSLGGRIDADAKLRLAPGQKPDLEGTATFREGTLHIAAIGEELRSVRASMKLSPNGIAIDDVYARGARGEIAAHGRVVLDGTHLVEATGDIRIPKNKPLNLAPDGQPIGEVSGTAHVRAAKSADGTSLVVDVPRATLEIPRVTKGGLQELERRDNVHVGVFRDREGKTFVTLPLARADTLRPRAVEAAPKRTEITVNVGQVEVVRGNQAQVWLTGHPKASVVADETKITGQIELTRGWVIVQGKKFVIERGTIAWTGEEEPGNPTVVATAGWAAPDGTRVFADFVGPAESGKVALRSEPALSKSDIVALILFGTTSGGNPTPTPPGTQPDGTTRAAVGIAGGAAAEGLANALDELTGLRATARIDTTRSKNLRPELEIQISPRVSISFAHVIGTPPITEPDRNLATIEYRFYKNWSVETTAGDRGRAMVDAIWQRRY